MPLWQKMLLFCLMNLLIAAVAANVPRGYTSGVEYLRQKVVFDYVRGLESGEPARVILGDSRAECCIAAGDLGFVNLSLSGSTPVEGYYILRELYGRGVDVQQAIIAFAPFHVFGQDTFYSRTRYFGLVDSDFVDEVESRAVELGDTAYQQYQWRALEVIDEWFPWLPEDYKFAVVNVLSMDKIVRECLGRITGTSSLPKGRLVVADPRVKLTRSVAPSGVNQGKVSPEFLHRDAHSPVNAVYLGKLVELARSHGTALSVLVTPFNRGVRQPGPEYLARFERLIGAVGLSRCFSGFRRWPNELFADPTHLNQRGAARLTQELSVANTFCEW